MMQTENQEIREYNWQDGIGELNISEDAKRFLRYSVDSYVEGTDTSPNRTYDLIKAETGLSGQALSRSIEEALAHNFIYFRDSWLQDHEGRGIEEVLESISADFKDANGLPIKHGYCLTRPKNYTIRSAVYECLRAKAKAEAIAALNESAGILSPPTQTNDLEGNILSNADAGIVYLLAAGPYYKIGKTTNVQSRLTTIKLQMPFKVELLHVIQTNNIHWLEKHWHQYFADKRENGEWFQLSESDVASFTAMKNVEILVKSSD